MDRYVTRFSIFKFRYNLSYFLAITIPKINTTDDLKLIANLSDKTVVDNDLKSLEDWERKWLLEFNSDKCKVLHIDLNDNEHLDYVLNGKKLKKTEQEKDLGVLTSGTLLWNDQIESCISKANQMLCWISRNLISREKSLMLRVYKTLIRPHLEYCVQLWNPAAEHGNWSLILTVSINSIKAKTKAILLEAQSSHFTDRWTEHNFQIPSATSTTISHLKQSNNDFVDVVAG